MTAPPPLLLLAQGRKPRARKAPVIRPRECRTHINIASVLREHIKPDWKFFHPANGELRDIRTAAKLKAMGVMPGISDLVLISPHGLACFLEIKREGEKLSDAQEAFQLWAIRHGIRYPVAFSFDQALAFLDALGCLRIRIGGER